MRIIFMGSAELAVPSLKALMESGKDDVVAVVAQPDRPAGRKRRLTSCPLKAFAQTQGLNVLTPEKIGAPDAVESLAALKPDLLVVVAYGQYIPSRVIDLAPCKAINVHPSLLPKYRGAAPIQWALLNGDRQTGVSIIELAKKMDAGAILEQASYPIEPDDTSQTLHDKLAVFGAELLLKAIEAIRQGNDVRTPQNDSEATEVRKLNKEDGVIDWTLPAEVIRNRIRAFNPWPGSSCSVPELGELKVWEAQVEAGSGLPGEVLDDRLLIATGSKALRLKMVQPPGKKRMEAAAFLNGFQVPVGTRLNMA